MSYLRQFVFGLLILCQALCFICCQAPARRHELGSDPDARGSADRSIRSVVAIVRTAKSEAALNQQLHCVLCLLIFTLS